MCGAISLFSPVNVILIWCQTAGRTLLGHNHWHPKI